MSLYSVSTLSVAISCTVIAVWALFVAKETLHRLFGQFNIAVAVWGLGQFLASVSPSEDYAILSWKLANLGGLFVAPSFLHLTNVFCKAGRNRLIRFGYAQALLFSPILAGTSLVISEVRQVSGVYLLIANPLYGVAVACYLVLVSVSFLDLLRHYRVSRGQDRIQTSYIIFGFGVGFIGANTVFLPMFGIDAFIPCGNFGTLLYTITLTYAIFRHRLLDLTFVLRKTLVYSIVVGLLTGLFVVLILAASHTVAVASGGSSFFAELAAALTVAFLFNPLRQRVQVLVDRYFHRTRYEYTTVVEQTGKALLTTLQLKEVVKLLVDTIGNTLGLSDVWYLKRAKDGRQAAFTLDYHFGRHRHAETGAEDLVPTPEFLSSLADSSGFVFLDDVGGSPWKQTASNTGSDLPPHDVHAAVPLYVQQEVEGILLLGPKASDQAINPEDVSLTRTLMTQAAIAYANAELYTNQEELVIARTFELMQANGSLQEEVAERRKAQSRLKEEAEFNVTVLNSLTDAISILDGRTHEILAVNQNFLDTYGLKRPSDVVGKKCYQVTHHQDIPCQPPADPCPMMETMRTGKPSIEEHIHRNRSGNTLYAEVLTTPFRNPESGTISKIIHVARDITKRKETERTLIRARESAEESVRLKSTFLANISHEIRTPLNGIIGMSEIMRDTTLEDDQRRYVDAIASESGMLLNLVNNLLDSSKIEAGMLVIEQAEFDLKAEMEDLAASYTLAAARKRIGLALTLAPKLPAILKGDRYRIRQVLTNLLGNAIKFTPEGGQIALEILPVSQEGDTMDLRFRVIDTGIGIQNEKLSLVFERFAQADASTTREYGGTGLGMAISRQLVELMGGEIGIQSQVGRGTTVWFELPLLRRGGPAESRDAQPSSRAGADPDEGRSVREPIPARMASPQKCLTGSEGGHGERILLVEDYPVNQQVAMIHLQAAGYLVDLAENGAEAAQLFEADRYGAILMDVQMPVMDGYSATGAIRDKELVSAGSRVPIIGLTAHASSTDRDKCIRAGMDDYLAKPLTRDLLVSTLARWVKVRPTEHAAVPAVPSASPAGSDDLLDLDKAISEFGNDRQLVMTLLEEFLERLAREAGELRGAIKTGDSEFVRKTAHSIKGGAANLRAKDLAEAAGLLEALGTSGNLSAGDELVNRFEHEAGRLRDRFEEVSSKPPRPQIHAGGHGTDPICEF